MGRRPAAGTATQHEKLNTKNFVVARHDPQMRRTRGPQRALAAMALEPLVDQRVHIVRRVEAEDQVRVAVVAAEAFGLADDAEILVGGAHGVVDVAQVAHRGQFVLAAGDDEQGVGDAFEVLAEVKYGVAVAHRLGFVPAGELAQQRRIGDAAFLCFRERLHPP